jgi:uncharacterized membrane protein YeiB
MDLALGTVLHPEVENQHVPVAGGIVASSNADPSGPGSPARSGGLASDRLVAFDIVRTLAILGMISVHVGPVTSRSAGHWAFLRQIEGRAAGTFALLLGSSAVLAFRSRSRAVGHGRAHGEQALRGVLLFAAGVVMTRWPSGVVVVLAVLGVASILVIPMVQWSARRAAVVALLLAVFGPPLSYVLRAYWLKQDYEQFTHLLGVARGPSFTSWPRFGWMIADLFFTGTYPLITWMPLVLVGVALARSDLRSRLVRRNITRTAVALLVIRFAMAPLMESVFKLDKKIPTAIHANYAWAPVEWAQSLIHGLNLGAVPTLDWRMLLLAPPHGGTTFELAGIVGIAMLAFRIALSFADAFPKYARIVSSPGRMAFTIYVSHVLTRYAIVTHYDDRGRVIAGHGDVLVKILLAAIVGSMLWLTLIKQGPLEWILRQLSRWPIRLIPKPRGKSEVETNVVL